MAGSFTTPTLANLTPAPKKMTLASNYLSFDSGSGGGTFAQQYLPEIYESEVERYGNRSVSSFLRMVGAELPMTSDQIIWSEQGRLHIAYTNAKFSVANDSTNNTINIANHAIRANQTIVVTGPSGVTVKAFVISVTAGAIVAKPYNAATWPVGFVTAVTNPDLKIFVYGSEFGKGQGGMVGSVEAGFQQFSNAPIIMKDNFEINGSDTAQIGWVEVTTENGASGYLWYIKSEHETRLRFEDYLEMGMVETEKAQHAFTDASATPYTVRGSEGLFAALNTRGNVYQGFSYDAGDATTGLPEFDTILKQLDKNGAIEENMLFLNRDTSLAFDNMLAGVNKQTETGSSYGVFNNEEDMALNLGFSGFRRGSYDFYKTDWKYLNDAATRGLTQDIKGVLVPAGTSTVYDQVLGKNIKRPFLHVRYRASEADDRRMKTWITGSVGGAYTSDIDKMQVNFLTERCLVTQAANNFVLFK